ncbi:MAG TPA: hypothetical protein VEF34_01340 [Syntrophobacteraceae bacterium]|nr:hypothetical protein [Syntrophobacteraceae bacterium]
MGVTVRQKVKGKGNPWWVFIAHNGKRSSRQIGDKTAAGEKSASQGTFFRSRSFLQRARCVTY